MDLTDDTQRHIQTRLDFSDELTGETREAHRGETESPGAIHGHQRPARTDRLMEEVCERDNLKGRIAARAGQQGGGGGRRHDGRRSAGPLAPALASHPCASAARHLYTEAGETGGDTEAGRRGTQAGHPDVLDRFIQQAVLQVLQRRWDGTFSPHSYGSRPGRSAHQAVAQAQQYIADGSRTVRCRAQQDSVASPVATCARVPIPELVEICKHSQTAIHEAGRGPHRSQEPATRACNGRCS